MRNAIILSLAMISLLTASNHCTAQDLTTLDGGTWSGEFRQIHPIAWQGKVLLTLKYDLSSDEGVPLHGVLSWPGLGNARTAVKGIRRGKSIEFVEKSCVKSCRRIMLGGAYSGNFKRNDSVIEGVASIPKFNYQGKFVLRRQDFPDDTK